MGLVFTPKLSWSKAKRKLAAQARKASFPYETINANLNILNLRKYFAYLIQW